MNTTANKILTYSIAGVWLVNGLICKVLDVVPRHKEIVARILGEEHAGVITNAIGISEILMMVWIVSGIRRRFNALTQILVIGAMNIIEFSVAPDLLLFGKLNILVAGLFICIVYFWGFVLTVKAGAAHAEIS